VGGKKGPAEKLGIKKQRGMKNKWESIGKETREFGGD